MADENNDHKDDATGQTLDNQGTPETAHVDNPKVVEQKQEQENKGPSKDELKGLIREVIQEMAPKEETSTSTDTNPVDPPKDDTKPVGVPWTHRGGGRR
jgi:hypothetical protein